MKATFWLIASPVLLVLGFVCLFQGVSGSTNLSAGSSLSAFVFEANIKATGGWVIIAILVELAALVVFLIGLVRAARELGRPRQTANPTARPEV